MRFRELFRKHMEDEKFKARWLESEPSFQAGNLLIKLRAAYGLTQAELAEKAGLKRPYIARVESGDANPTVRTLGKVLNAFDLSLVLDFRLRDEPVILFEQESATSMICPETTSTTAQPITEDYHLAPYSIPMLGGSRA